MDVDNTTKFPLYMLLRNYASQKKNTHTIELVLLKGGALNEDILKTAAALLTNKCRQYHKASFVYFFLEISACQKKIHPLLNICLLFEWGYFE